jgi:RHS repeat-associated protein
VQSSVAIGYNQRLLLDTLAVAKGTMIRYAYDNDGALTTAGDLTFTRSATTGLPESTTLRTIKTSVPRNDFGEVETFTASTGAQNLLTVSYTYDGLGRIATRTERVLGEPETTSKYSYSASGRLIGADDGLTARTWTYDGNGNRLSDNAVYDDQDRLISQGLVTFHYDQAGRLAERTDGLTNPSAVTRYQYDALGSLLGVTLPNGQVVSYEVDGLGRRVSRASNGSWIGYLYQSQLRIAALVDTAGAVTSQFVYGNKENVPEYMINGGVKYRIISDERGSVRLVVNAADGSVAQRMDYDAWGVVTADTNPGFQPFGFAGGLYDAETGLVRFGARDYDASIGRWISKDPNLFGGGQGNLFVYVGNDPVNLIDPSGLAAADAGAAVGCVVGAATAATGCVGVAVGTGGLAVPVLLPGCGAAMAEACAAGGLAGAAAGAAIDIAYQKPPADAYNPNGPKAPGKPGANDGFVGPKGGDNWVRNPNGKGWGWEDASGDVWVPTGLGGLAHGGPHWDVQTPGGGYRNQRPKCK